MRKESDRGVVVVLDKRVDSKSYGRAFVKSVFPLYGQPDVWVQRATVPQAAREISAFTRLSANPHIMSRIYAAIDLEMTGLKPGLDEIIEVGVVRCTPERVLERWSTLVQPLELPPLRVQRMTGITPEMLAEAPAWSEVEDKLRSLLDGCTLIGHNVGFDESFLEVVGIKSATPSIDTLPLAQIIEPGASSHRLGELCDRFNIELTDAHRALADAEAARLLFLRLKDRYARLPRDARNSLSELAAGANIFLGTGPSIARLVA